MSYLIVIKSCFADADILQFTPSNISASVIAQTFGIKQDTMILVDNTNHIAKLYFQDENGMFNVAGSLELTALGNISTAFPNARLGADTTGVLTVRNIHCSDWEKAKIYAQLTKFSEIAHYLLNSPKHGCYPDRFYSPISNKGKKNTFWQLVRWQCFSTWF